MPNSNLPLMLNARGADVVYLHVSLSKLGYTIPKHELDEQVFGVGTRDALLQLQARYRLSRTGVFDDATRTALEGAVAGAEIVEHRVEGRIFFDYGVPARGIVVRLYNQSFGGAETRLGEETKTDAQGYYLFTYDPGGKAVNLKVRVLYAQGKEIVLCDTMYEANKHKVQNLVAPSSKVQPLTECHRLTRCLDKQLSGLDKLIDAQENDQLPYSFIEIGTHSSIPYTR